MPPRDVAGFEGAVNRGRWGCTPWVGRGPGDELGCPVGGLVEEGSELANIGNEGASGSVGWGGGSANEDAVADGEGAADGAGLPRSLSSATPPIAAPPTRLTASTDPPRVRAARLLLLCEGLAPTGGGLDWL